jgi:hypothetical protein
MHARLRPAITLRRTSTRAFAKAASLGLQARAAAGLVLAIRSSSGIT